MSKLLVTMAVALPIEVKRGLAEHLLQELPAIRTLVLHGIRSHCDEIPSSRSLTDQELLDHFPRLFADLAEYLLNEADPGARTAVLDVAKKHGETRSQQGYHLAELIREIGIVHGSIVDHGLEQFLITHPHYARSAGECSRLVGKFFEDSVVGSVQRYVDKFNENSLLTNQKLSEANDRLNQLDAFRLQLMRTVHHELGNALNAVIFSIEYAMVTNDAAAQRDMLEGCRRNTEEMKSLLSQLNDYSVLVGGEVPVHHETIEVASFARELEVSLRAMIQDAGMSLVFQVDPDLVSINSDRSRIHQMANNLVSNAVKYRNAENTNGSVVIKFQSRNTDFWQMIVEDSGIGIPEEHLRSIFQEFKRLAPSENIPGQGLGLAITQRLVTELKGTIEVISEVNRGTRFVITLPKRSQN
jgi:nitrogen-specific signal transduction histidine kinase